MDDHQIEVEGQAGPKRDATLALPRAASLPLPTQPAMPLEQPAPQPSAPKVRHEVPNASLLCSAKL
jgi:hypothetical protein